MFLKSGSGSQFFGKMGIGIIHEHLQAVHPTPDTFPFNNFTSSNEQNPIDSPHTHPLCVLPVSMLLICNVWTISKHKTHKAQWGITSSCIFHHCFVLLSIYFRLEEETLLFKSALIMFSSSCNRSSKHPIMTSTMDTSPSATFCTLFPHPITAKCFSSWKVPFCM